MGVRWGQLLAILWFSAMARPVSAEEQPRFGVAPPQPWVTVLRAEQVRLADQDCDAQEALGPIASYITLSTR